VNFLSILTSLYFIT